MIRYYNTEAEYNSATKSPSESQVSLVGAGNAIKYDGRSVVVGAVSAKTGSIVVLDASSALHFISVDTYTAGTFPAGWTTVGVVAVGVDHEDYRGKLVVVHKTNDVRQASFIYSYRLTGYTLDGAQHTGGLSVRQSSDSWAANHAYEVTYAASTVTEMVAALNAFFTANEPFISQDWVAVEVDGAIDLQFRWSVWQQSSYNGAGGGFNVIPNLLPNVVPSAAMLRVNGARGGEGAIINMPRALVSFRNDTQTTVYNPSSDVTSVKVNYPICLPGYLGTSRYQSDHCAFLRSVYGEGEEGWLRFMAAMRVVQPSAYGIMDTDAYGDGWTNTYKMAGKTFTGQDGTVHEVHPAADYCAAVGYNHDLLAQGKWHLPHIGTIDSVMKCIQYSTTNDRNADPVNRALYAIGGTEIRNNAYFLSASRCSAAYGWFFYGDAGYAAYGGLFVSFRALPVLLLDVSEANA